MDYNTISNAIIHYGSIVLGIMFALTTAVTLIVEVVKRLLPKIPTDLVVFIISITLTMLAMYVYASIMEIAVMWYYVVGTFVFGVFVAYAAMFGFDKFKEAFNKLQIFKTK